MSKNDSLIVKKIRAELQDASEYIRATKNIMSKLIEHFRSLPDESEILQTCWDISHRVQLIHRYLLDCEKLARGKDIIKPRLQNAIDLTIELSPAIRNDVQTICHYLIEQNFACLKNFSTYSTIVRSLMLYTFANFNQTTMALSTQEKLQLFRSNADKCLKPIPSILQQLNNLYDAITKEYRELARYEV